MNRVAAPRWPTSVQGSLWNRLGRHQPQTRLVRGGAGEALPRAGLFFRHAKRIDFPPMVRLALGTGDRQARNGDSLASPRFQDVLALEVPGWQVGPARDRPRNPGVDPADVPRRSDLGCAAIPIGVERAGQSGTSSAIPASQGLDPQEHQPSPPDDRGHPPTVARRRPTGEAVPLLGGMHGSSSEA